MHRLGVVLLSAALAAVPEKRTIVRFDDDSIDGRLQRPETDLTAGRRERVKAPLFQPPAHFDERAREEAIEAFEGRRKR